MTNHLMGQALPFGNLTSHQAPGDLSPAGVSWFLSPCLDLLNPYSLLLSHRHTHNTPVGEHHREPSRELGVCWGFRTLSAHPPRTQTRILGGRYPVS